LIVLSIPYLATLTITRDSERLNNLFLRGPLMRFEDARDQLDRYAVGELNQRKWDRYRSTVRSNAVIEWTREGLRPLFEEGLVEQADEAARVGRANTRR
jgi:hypothetical protein